MKWSLALFSALLLLGPTSCSSENPSGIDLVAPQETEIISDVGLLISTDEVSPNNELDGTYTTYVGRWDLETGRVEYDAEPKLVTTGPDRQFNVLSWDGKNQYIVWDETCISSTDESTELLPCREAFQDGKRTIWGPGYRLTLTSTEKCEECTVTRDGKTPVSFENLYRSLDSSVVDLESMSFLGCDLTGDTLILVYDCTNLTHEKDILLQATLNLPQKQITWAKPISITAEQAQGIRFSYPYYPIINQKMYFSEWDTIAYYDFSKNKIIQLETLPAKIQALLPNTERTTFDDRPLSSNLMGRTKDVVVSNFEYSEGTISHTVYLAIRDGQVLGTLDWQRNGTRSSITTYGADWKPLCQIDLPTKDATVLTMPTVVSPRPF